jgi:deoxyadenosine/deoxycytidine kinase
MRRFRIAVARKRCCDRSPASASRERVRIVCTEVDIEKCRYIVVEGPIGAGKTSLAIELAQRLSADTLLERPADNPFLARFYDDMSRYALPTQLNFLFQRIDQLTGVGQLDMFGRAIVGDFLLDKDPLFARLNLTDAEYRLYEKIYAHLKPQAPVPDLVVYLQAPLATLVERVHRRGVDYERAISEHYLARIADAYSRHFYQYDGAPLLIVNSERLNFVANPKHVDLLLERIATLRGRREFFNLGQSA